MVSLILDNLSCRRNERMVFSALNLSLQPGEALLLIGPNGSGKTSLLRILAGLLDPSEGQVKLEPADPDRDIAQRMILISARDALKNAFTVAEQIASFRDVGFSGEDAGDPTQAALSLFGLAPLANVPCGYLSSGQRRRVSLARLALSTAGQRPVWLLDEPANALDAASRAELARLVAVHRAAGGVVVAATHDPLGWPQTATLDLSQAGGPP